MSTKAELTPNQILKKNLANIVKKVERDKTLTAAELALIRGQAMGEEDMPAYAKDQVELAKLLDVDRKTIQRWLKEDENPGRQSNGKYSVPDWAEFKLEKDRANSKAGSSDKETADKSALEIRKLIAVCNRLEWEQEQRRGAYREVADVERQVAQLCGAIKQSLLAVPAKYAAMIAMRPVDECEVVLKEAIDEVLHQLHKGEWPTHAPTPLSSEEPPLEEAELF